MKKSSELVTSLSYARWLSISSPRTDITMPRIG